MPYTEKTGNLARIALHNPKKIKKKNRSILNATHEQLEEMARYGSKKRKK